jgi:thioredoxin-related protein
MFTFNVKGEEVKFQSVGFDEAMNLARKENKMLYIDCMTEWCGWCKVMDKNTFTNDEVAAMLNNKFIALKIDMEKGYGVNLAMKYHIRSFPTAIIINSAGELIYKQSGYQDAKQFLSTLTSVLNGEGQMKFPGISTKVDMAYPDFYKQRFINDKKKAKPNENDADKFLATQKDLLNEISWSIILTLDVNEKHEEYFITNMAKYRELYGNEVDDKMENIIYSRTEKAVKEKNETKLNEIIALIDKNFNPEQAEQMKLNCKLEFYLETGSYKTFSKILIDHLEKIEYNNAEMINNYAWILYEKCDDKEVLLNSIDWVEKAFKYKADYAIMDTYAALLYKTGQKDKAIAAAKKAIATGEENKEDVSSTEKLLLKIEAMK